MRKLKVAAYFLAVLGLALALAVSPGADAQAAGKKRATAAKAPVAKKKPRAKKLKAAGGASQAAPPGGRTVPSQITTIILSPDKRNGFTARPPASQPAGGPSSGGPNASRRATAPRPGQEGVSRLRQMRESLR